AAGGAGRAAGAVDVAGRRGSAAGGQRHVPPARPGRADAGSIVARPPADQRDAAPVVQRECSPVPPGGASGRRALVGGRQTRRPGGRRQGTSSDPACSRGARASFLHEEANSFTHSQTESDTLFVGSTLKDVASQRSAANLLTGHIIVGERGQVSG